MKKLVLGLTLAAGATTLLASCANNSTTKQTTTTSTLTPIYKSTTTSSTKEAKDITYTVTVVDLDGEVLLDNEEFSTKEGSKSFVSDLKAKGIDVSTYTTEYGTSVASVANSVVDSNYYLAFTVNDNYASVTAADYEIQDKDNLKLVNTCWNTIESGYGKFDSYDVLVDKAFYHYSKVYMQDLISDDTTYKGSNYWTYMTLNLLNKYYYDSNLFNTKSATEYLINSIKNEDVAILSGTNIGKYYWTASALGLLTDDFKNSFGSLISSNLTTYSDWTSPFIVAPAYSLGYQSADFASFVENAEESSTQYGTDALAWQVASLAMFDKYSDNTVLEKLNVRGQNGISTSLQLMAFAALGESPRAEKYEVEGKDLIEYLFDNFYDSEFEILITETDKKEINQFSNQIYASLAAYKVVRDQKALGATDAKAYIFA